MRVFIDSAALVLGAGLLMGLPGGAASAATAEPCPQACAMVYQPVSCQLSDGTVMKFGNRCVADAYACRHRVRIIGCVAERP